MGLDQPAVIDFVGTDRESGEVVLTIADSWDWSDERSHLLALQAKFNAYLEFIQSGQMVADYPHAVGRRLRIDYVHRFPLPPVAHRTIAYAAEATSVLDVRVQREYLPDVGT